MYCLNKKTHKLFIELIIAKVSMYLLWIKIKNHMTKYRMIIAFSA